jgi:hypothetical protein
MVVGGRPVEGDTSYPWASPMVMNGFMPSALDLNLDGVIFQSATADKMFKPFNFPIHSNFKSYVLYVAMWFKKILTLRSGGV